MRQVTATLGPDVARDSADLQDGVGFLRQDPTWGSRNDLGECRPFFTGMPRRHSALPLCGRGQEGDLYESRYNPKGRIGKLCAFENAAVFKETGHSGAE